MPEKLGDSMTCKEDDNEEGQFIESNEKPTISSTNPKAPTAENFLTFNVYGKRKCKIHKQLLLLKISVFAYALGNASVYILFPLFLKSRGISIEELSATVAASAVIQFIIPFVSGIVADRIGRAKPILLFYMCCILILSTGLIFMPSIEKCVKENSIFHCSTLDYISSMQESTQCNWTSKINHCFNNTYNCTMPSVRAQHEYNIVLSQCFFNSNLTNSSKYQTSFFCKETTNGSCEIHCLTDHESCLHSDVYGTTLLSAYFILIPIFYFLRSAINSFYEVTMVNVTKEYNASYAMHRIWKVCGNAVGAPLSGYIVSELQVTDYTRFLYFFIVFIGLALICVLKINVHPLQPNKQILHTAKILVRNPNLFAFVLVLVACGVCLGMESVYFSWYLKTINIPIHMIGLISMVGSFSGVPYLFLSKWLTKTLKNKNIFIIALLSHGTYCIAFSYLQNAWPAFVVELLFGINFDLFWVAVVQFCQKISPVGMISTVIATASTIHFNIGIALGTVYGGSVTHRYSLRIAYRIIGCVAYVTALLYAMFLLTLCMCKRQCRKPSADSVTPEMARIEEDVFIFEHQPAVT